MKRECEYSIVNTNNGYSIDRTTQPFFGPVAFIKPTLGRYGKTTDCNLEALVTR